MGPRVVLFLVLVVALTSALSSALPSIHRRQTSPLRLKALQLAADAPPPPPDNTSSDDLDALFDQIADLDPADVPPELQQAIRNKIDATAPSDLEVRLRVMGFTPLTVAGYALAAVLIALNTVLGTGWASTLLGFNDMSSPDVRYVGKDDGAPPSPSPRATSTTPGVGSRRAEIDAFVKDNIDEIRGIR